MKFKKGTQVIVKVIRESETDRKVYTVPGLVVNFNEDTNKYKVYLPFQEFSIDTTEDMLTQFNDNVTTDDDNIQFIGNIPAEDYKFILEESFE